MLSGNLFKTELASPSEVQCFSWDYYFHFQPHFTQITVFDVRRMQHIILGFLWYLAGIPVVLKGELLWYSFRCTSAFSVSS